MKKALTIGSAMFIIFGLLCIAIVFRPVRNMDVDGRPLFNSFPLNQPRTVNFAANEDAAFTGSSPSAKDRERRRLDQLRDWCLLTIISESGLPPKEIAETVYDLPAIRQETLRRVANFEYGETRSRVIGNGKVVALVPSDSADAMQASARQRDNLARIADEQRKNLGDIPTELIVFEYELLPLQNEARITRRDSILGKDLFTPLYGYHESDIGSLQDLRAFMEATDDLTCAHKSSRGLRVGGRKHLREPENGELPYGRIGVEGLTAIWRGQQGLKEFQGCGFSLDPRLDMQKMNATFNSLIAPQLLPHNYALVAKAREILARKPGTPEEARVNEFEFVDTLHEVCGQSRDPAACTQTMNQLFWENSYQAARYEGQHLAGTEVGMILFYTDLLMKLWSFDLADSSPGHDRIPDFPTTTEMQFANIFKSEFERAPETRLWLGPLTAGFQIADERRSLLFARNATRVFAHAADLLMGRDNHDVPEPNIFERTFINWWNDHYEEIARYEPQYERLNEILKWSVLINWLDEQEQKKMLRFLDQDAPDAIQVTRTNYFTQWKDQHPELRFRGWNQLNFDKQADARAENESLDIVKSKIFPAFGEKLRWEGGVSLADRAAIREAEAATEGLLDVAPAARRAGIDSVHSDLAAGRLRTLEATEFNFKNYSEEAVSTLARAKPSAKLTDAFGELENVGFDRTIRSTSEGFLMRTRAEGEEVLGDLGDLRITRNPDGFQVRWQSREIDRGLSLGRKLSQSSSPSDLLSAEPEVEASISIDGGKSYLVKMQGTDRWIKLAPAESDSMAIGKGFQARVSGIGDNARPIEVGWLEGDGVTNELRSNGYLKIAPVKNESDGVVMECCGRAPPPDAKEFYVEREELKVIAYRDSADQIYIRTDDIPAQFRSDPIRIAERRLSADDLRVARDFEAGHYRELADELASDPATFQGRLDRILDEGIARNNRLIAHQQFEEALEQTQQLIEINGPVPELTYRQALLEAKVGDAEKIADSLNSSFARPVRGAEKFLDEVEFRLQNVTSVEERFNLRRIEDFADWNSYSEKSGTVVSFTRDAQLHLEWRTGQLPAGETVRAEELHMALVRGDPIYLPDTPGFANLDVYTSPGEASLHQLPSFQVTKLPLNDVSHFRPTLMRELGTNSKWYLYNYVRDAQSASQYVRYQPTRCDQQDKECYVYVVMPARDSQR
jgi:hypothetical protein